MRRPVVIALNLGLAAFVVAVIVLGSGARHAPPAKTKPSTAQGPGGAPGNPVRYLQVGEDDRAFARDFLRAMVARDEGRLKALFVEPGLFLGAGGHLKPVITVALYGTKDHPGVLARPEAGSMIPEVAHWRTATRDVLTISYALPEVDFATMDQKATFAAFGKTWFACDFDRVNGAWKVTDNFCLTGEG